MEFLCAKADFALDPWQVLVLETILGERADGRWAARDAAFLVSRQNGKGGILHALDLAGLFLFDDVQEILHSAHEHKTAKKAYRELRDIIRACPALHAQVERRGTRVVGFRHSNEDTSITLQSGKVIRFIARSKNSARGFSPQMVIIDEAQECSGDTRDALKYTTRAQTNPIRVWCGTVPSEANNGQVFKDLRDRGRKGGDRSLAWLEWNPPDDVDPRSDEAIVWATPGMPYRVEFDTVADERDAALVSDEAWAGFCREALSVWPDVDDTATRWQFVPEAQWNDRLDGEAPEDGWLADPITLSVELSQDGETATLCAAGAVRDGVGVTAVFRGPASELVAEVVAWKESGRVGRWVLDTTSRAAALRDDLEAAGVEFTEIKTGELREATGWFVDRCRDGGVWRREDPWLTDSLASAVPRRHGNAWLVNRWADGDPTPTIGAISACWGHLQGPADDGVSVYEQRGPVVLG